MTSISVRGNNVDTTTSTTETYASEVHSTIIETTEQTSTTETTTAIETTEKVNKCYSKQDAIDIAKVLYRECRGIPSITEQACVAWTILNRVDKQNSSIYSVVRAPHQYAFNSNTPVRDNLLELAYDVLDRWSREKQGETDVGRVLPKSYIYFEGDGKRNYFRDKYQGNYNIWDYSLETPYES